MTADTSRCSQHSSNASSASLRNPHKFNINLEMDGQYYNLWSTDNDRTDANDEVVIKSVYDPSPVGYSLPASNAFTGFTTTGQNVGSWPNPLTPEQLAQINAKQPFDKGYYFYTKLNKQGETIYFKLSGCRRGITGILQAINSRGWNWYAIPNTIDSKLGKVFDFQQFDIRPLDIGNPRSDGMSVRSAEKKVRRKILRRINFLSSQWGQHKCHRSVCMRNRPRRSVSYGKQAHSFDLCLLYWRVL